MIIDIHTHQPGSPDAVLSLSPEELALAPLSENRFYSVGFHPWNLPPAGPSEEAWALFDRLVDRKDVVAVGECGLDLLRGPLLAIQMNVFRRQAERAERAGKPVIIHCVKAFQQLIGMKSEMRPEVSWALHGFRGKPEVCRMLVRAGFWISVGEKFNTGSLEVVPRDRLLCETDEGRVPLSETLSAIAAVLNLSVEETRRLLEANAASFLFGMSDNIRDKR